MGAHAAPDAARGGRMNRIKLLRYEQGLTLEEASKASGVPVRTIARAEAGETQLVASTAKRLADFYRVSVADLLGVEQAA